MQIERRCFRNSANYGIAVASEVFRPVLTGAAALLCPRRPSPPETWRQGLLLGADHIGDVLYCTPSLPFLKKGLPNCEWHFEAPSLANQVLENNPWLGTGLAGRHYDAVICYDSGGYGKSVWHALRRQIPNRVAYTYKGLSAWVTHPLPIRHPQPYPAYFRDLVAHLTGQTPDWPLRPLVYPSQRDESDASALWTALRLDASRPVLVCFPFSRQPHGQWPPDAFGRALQILQAAMPIQLVLAGSADDEPTLLNLGKKHGLDCHINAGRLNLRALTRFLARCQAALTADSGPRHTANAAGIPVYFIRNLWPRRIETGAYLPSETDLAPDDECIDPERQEAILAKITPELAARRMLERLAHPA